MFNFFKKNKKKPENLEEIISQFEDLKKHFSQVLAQMENLKKDHQFTIQKIGLIRFNPFFEVGGNQSFSLALLDGNNNGVVLTSLYTREGNRIYGKPIKNGKSEYLLSQEEEAAIAKAINSTLSNSQIKSKNENKKSKFNSKTARGSNFGPCR
jgi:hypothetical protein